MSEFKKGDIIKIICQLTPEQPIGTIAKIISLHERNPGLWYNGGQYEYKLDIGGYYWEDHIEKIDNVSN